MIIKILGLIEGRSQAQVARKLRISKQRVSKLVSRAHKEGLIFVKVRSSFTEYGLTPLGRKALKEYRKSTPRSLGKRDASCGLENSKDRDFLYSGQVDGVGRSGAGQQFQPKTIDFHNLHFKLPILSHEGRLRQLRGSKMQHWVEKYVYPGEGFPATFKGMRVTTKSVIVSVKPQKFVSDPDFEWRFREWFADIVYAAKRYLEKEGVVTGRAYIIRQHIAQKAPEFDKHVARSMTLEVPTGRVATGSTGPLKDRKGRLKAETVWIDRSNGPLEVESQSFAYARDLALLPVHAAQASQAAFVAMRDVEELKGTLIPILEEVGRQLKLHLEVESAQRDNQVVMNKSLESLNAGIADMNRVLARLNKRERK